MFDFSLSQFIIQSDLLVAEGEAEHNMTSHVFLGMDKFLKETWPNADFTMITDRIYTHQI